MKTHWLFGMGPKKEVRFKIEVDEETNCTKCMHVRVCDRVKEKRCFNFEFGNSLHTGCDSCFHRFTRQDKERIPCFHCKDFLASGIDFRDSE